MNLLKLNLEEIKNRFPGLENLILNAPEGTCVIEEARNGSLTMRKDGILLHSGFHPEKEAEKLISREILESTRYCLFFGFGLGYHIEAFHRKFPQIPFGIIEPDPGLFKQALSCRDFTCLIRSGKMNLMLGSDPSLIHLLLGNVKTLKIQTCLLRSIYQTSQEIYDALERAARDYIAKREINTNTHNRFNRLWISNITRNSPLLAKAPGIFHLKDRFSNVPALLLAAGPGLDSITGNLAELRKKMLLVCVDTALKALLTKGIEPDFTVLTDPQYWNTRHLDRCELKNSILISDVSSYPTVFRITKGQIFFCSTPFPLGQYLEERTEFKGKLKSGGSVATAAWDLLRFMGTTEIYCAGLDLSFPEKQTHYKGSTFEQRVHNFSHRYETLENHGWHALHSGSPFKTENYLNQKVLTDQRMKIYISWFEQQMRENPEILTSNLSDKGVRIHGMPFCTKDRLFKLPEIRKELDKILSDLKKITVPVSSDRIPGIIDDLIGELQDLFHLTEQGKQLSEAGKNGTLDIENLKELEKVDKAILSSGNKEIIGFFILPLLEDFLAESEIQQTPEKIMERSEKLYKDLSVSLNYQIRQLEKVKKTVFS